MRLKFSLTLLLLLINVSLLVPNNFVAEASSNVNVTKDFYFGVDIAYYNFTQFKAEVDEVSAYTNLIVIGTTGITNNVTLLDEACQYAYNKGLSFIVYVRNIRLNQTQWFQNETGKWSDNFLGIYSAADEFAGKQLDLDPYRAVWEAEDYSDAAKQYVANLTGNLNRITRYFNGTTTFPIFISEYALYWFDFKAGCDTVFGELGWNYSRQLNIALCRGAATVQNKEWGAMITWTYTNPPYIESGPELYDDLKLAYDNGAKYILIFDSNKEYSSGILQTEHLAAMEQFWNYAQANPRTKEFAKSDVAFVLPNDYGYGFRGPNDKIWGLWQADDFAVQLCNALNDSLGKYGPRMDIIYDDPDFQNYVEIYREILFWNGTTRVIALPTSIPTVEPSIESTYLVPSYSPTQNVANADGGSWPPWVVAFVAAAAAIFFMIPLAFMNKKKVEKKQIPNQEYLPYNSKISMISNESTANRSYSHIGRNSSDFSLKSPTSNKRNPQVSLTSQFKQSTVSKYKPVASYPPSSYSTRICRHCKQKVKEGYNVCPICLKKLK